MDNAYGYSKEDKNTVPVGWHCKKCFFNYNILFHGKEKIITL